MMLVHEVLLPLGAYSVSCADDAAETAINAAHTTVLIVLLVMMSFVESQSYCKGSANRVQCKAKKQVFIYILGVWLTFGEAKITIFIPIPCISRILQRLVKLLFGEFLCHHIPHIIAEAVEFLLPQQETESLVCDDLMRVELVHDTLHTWVAPRRTDVGHIEANLSCFLIEPSRDSLSIADGLPCIPVGDFLGRHDEPHRHTIFVGQFLGASLHRFGMWRGVG